MKSLNIIGFKELLLLLFLRLSSLRYLPNRAAKDVVKMILLQGPVLFQRNHMDRHLPSTHRHPQQGHALVHQGHVEEQECQRQSTGLNRLPNQPWQWQYKITDYQTPPLDPYHHCQ